MSGAIDKKLIEVREELDSSPNTHLSARTGILNSVTLIREFSETRLNALCEKFTSTSGDYSLAQICEALARQRLICWGARSIQTTFRKFDFPLPETVNGALDLTEANTSFMGIKATDISETYTINLTSLAGTQTQDSNTFSTDVRDYYLVRSRVNGELIDINDSIIPYSTPDSDTVFGNAIAWGEDVTTEAGTWNADYAKANIASVGLQSEGLFNELNTMTLQDHLEQGSNTNYTTLGAAFGQKFYLKRHADFVNTFTIIGTTTVDSIEVTGISDSDLTKIKYGDVISGTGIPDDNVTIAGVKTTDSKIRLSNTGIATADGTVTLTVNSVPFGYQENDIFCQVEVVGEGLVINQDWKPVGDDAGDYSGSNAGADDLLNANTSQFIGLLNFFDPDNGSANASNDLTKGARGDWVSTGKEYGGTSYPYKEQNPFFPAIGGTHKAYEIDNGEIVGTQPTGLGEDDIPSGRYVRWDVKRADETGALPENRYYIDSAEKFYYEVPCTNISYTSGTSGVIGTNHPMPNVGEPPTTMTKTGLSGVVTRVSSDTVTIAGPAGAVTMDIQASLTGDVPIDDDTSNPDTSGSSGSPPTWGGNSYYTLVNNWIYKNAVHIESTSQPGGSGIGSWTLTLDTDVTAFSCRYNYAQKKLYEAGGTANTTMNADVKFIQDTVDDLQAIDAFRDPVVTGAQAGVSGISDEDFDDYIASEPDGDLTNLQDALSDFRTAWAAGSNSRTGDDNGNLNKGEVVSFANTTWAAFHTEVGTFGTNCSKRAAEIDARIGVPTRGTRFTAVEISCTTQTSTTVLVPGVTTGIYVEMVVSGAGIPLGATVVSIITNTSFVLSEAATASATVDLTLGGAAISRGTPPAIYVSAIPTANTTGGLVPYGRALYNSCNYILGKDLKLMTQLIQDIQSLAQLVGLVKSARNKYEIFNGRAKEYS